MKAKELMNLSVEQLVSEEKKLKEELFNLRFQLATGQLQDTTKLNKCKKNIARVKTAITAKNSANV